MAEGFRAAQAFVEVGADLDARKVVASARDAAQGIDRELQDGGRRAGASLTAALSQAGSDAGHGLIKGLDAKMRDGQGRFVRSGVQFSTDVIKGAGDETDRNGFRAFLGLIKGAPQAGLSAASGLMGALRSGISGPATPYLMAALVPAAAATAPILGSIIAGGLMAGVSSVALGGMIAVAVRDPEVKHAATRTGQEIMGILADAVHPIKGELVDAFGIGEQAVRRWRPELNRIASATSSFIRPLTAGLVGLVDRLLPGMTRMIESSRPAIDALSRGLVMTGEHLGKMMDSLSDNGPEAAAGITTAFLLLNGTLDTASFLINGFVETLGVAMEMSFRMGEFVAGLGVKLSGLPGPLGDIGDKLVSWGQLTHEGERGWDALRESMTGATTAGQSGAKAVSDQTLMMNMSMGAAITQAGSLSKAFQALNGAALDAREAESAYQAAIDNVTASMKTNGRTLDLNTEKGRANDSAVRQLISSIDAKAQATYDEVKATQGATAAEAAAMGVYEQGRAQLIKNLTQLLGNADAARKMADQIMKIPKTWSTTVNLDDKATPIAQRIRKEITQIHGKTVVVTVKYETRGDVPGEHHIGRGTLTRASGGWITGGSGVRDDVPVLAMRDEFMLQQKAALALRRDYGPRFLDELNNYHNGGLPPAAPRIEAARAPVAARAASTPAPPPTAQAGRHITFAAGSIVLDVSGVRSLTEFMDMIESLPQVARAMGSQG